MMKQRSLWAVFGFVLGCLVGLMHIPWTVQLGEGVSTLFLRFVRLLGIPFIFFAIFSTVGSMNVKDLKMIGSKTLFYTCLTTGIAALVAWALYFIIHPVHLSSVESKVVFEEGGYLSFVSQLLPNHILEPFLNGNVIGLAFLAISFGIGASLLPEEQKKGVISFFSGMLAILTLMIRAVVVLMPLAIFGFSIVLVHSIQSQSGVASTLVSYLCVIIGANLIQGCVVLPLLLKRKRIAILEHFTRSIPALTVAFFSKSSNVALPVALQCSERMGIDAKVARCILPLCSVINMNGCAAFIITTVLFVSESNGIVFSFFSSLVWVMIAVIAAIGNAGIPLGCFFLTSALLAGSHVPLHLMGLILPFYGFLDMIETSLNIWSDLSITALVDREIKEIEAISPASYVNLG